MSVHEVSDTGQSSQKEVLARVIKIVRVFNQQTEVQGCVYTSSLDRNGHRETEAEVQALDKVNLKGKKRNGKGML